MMNYYLWRALVFPSVNDNDVRSIDFWKKSIVGEAKLRNVKIVVDIQEFGLNQAALFDFS